MPGCSKGPTGPGLKLQVAALAGDQTCKRNLAGVRFNEMVRPGDSLTRRGRVKDQTTGNGRRQLLLEVWAENQRAERVTVGEAEVHII